MLQAITLFLFVVCCLSTACFAEEGRAAGADGLRVMSFNVRNSNAMDLTDHWSFRKDLFFKTIGQFDPDLLGMQEVLADQYDETEKRMKDGYTLVGVARDDGKRKGEWSCILFRTERFEKLADGTFWLSETPEVAGSKAWDADLTRICTWARLKDKKTGKTFVFANTHFDHRGKVARVKSAELLARKLPELSQGAPVILTGDFNTTEDDKPYKALVKAGADPGAVKLVDGYREVHPDRATDEASFHGFKGTVAGSRIDWILHTPELKAASAGIDRTKGENGKYPSDHYAVTAVLEWK
jgi:endonuclease/exonuclease/phosphatase family metal-dependent hydrolase